MLTFGNDLPSQLPVCVFLVGVRAGAWWLVVVVVVVGGGVSNWTSSFVWRPYLFRVDARGIGLQPWINHWHLDSPISEHTENAEHVMFTNNALVFHNETMYKRSSVTIHWERFPETQQFGTQWLSVLFLLTLQRMMVMIMMMFVSLLSLQTSMGRSVYMSVCLSLCSPVCVTLVSLPVCLLVGLWACLSVCLSVCLPHLYVCLLSDYLSVCW